MKVISVTPRGYCKGVVNAINIAKQTRDKYPNEPIYILGRLVHNKYVVEALFDLNIITLDDLHKSRSELIDCIDSGIVIFSAHGTSEEVYQKARDKGLMIIDATCNDVKKTQIIINEFLDNGYTVLYIGVKNHPESLSVLKKNSPIYLITSLDDINNLKLTTDKIMVINQTTMSINDIAYLHQQINKYYPFAIIYEEICSATRVRQQAILNLEKVDLTYIVGDPNSNNTMNLVRLAKNNSTKVCLIESVKDINIEDLININKVAVTSGASTPTALTQQVIDYLTNFQTEKNIPEITKAIL
ncbi:MAG: 4-hydroxy-3-methylbut-2-enyl diphosphate reductase [Erysipelotrichaceae bacterium]|nr:4-hydroxy-3-methylbut-2-enyl diphosphate reductase [Erysipelotrichaceae bacterium]